MLGVLQVGGAWHMVDTWAGKAHLLLDPQRRGARQPLVHRGRHRERCGRRELEVVELPHLSHTHRLAGWHGGLSERDSAARCAGVCIACALRGRVQGAGMARVDAKEGAVRETAARQGCRLACTRALRNQRAAAAEFCSQCSRWRARGGERAARAGGGGSRRVAYPYGERQAQRRGRTGDSWGMSQTCEGT